MLPPGGAGLPLHDVHYLGDTREIQESKAAEGRGAPVVVVAHDKGDDVEDEGREFIVKTLAGKDEAGDVVASKRPAREKGLDGGGSAEEVIGLVGGEEVEVVDGETDFEGEDKDGGGVLVVHFESILVSSDDTAARLLLSYDVWAERVDKVGILSI